MKINPRLQALATGLLLSATLTFAPVAHGQIFVVSGNDNSVRQFTLGGVGSVFVPTSVGLVVPAGMAFDNARNLYVVNNGNHTIDKFAPDGTRTVFGILDPISCSGIAFDNAGANLYVASYGNSTIFKFAPNGTRSVFVTGLNIGAVGMAFDTVGNLYVAGQGDNTIRKFDNAGTGSVFVNAGGGLNGPCALAFKSGVLYVACLNDHTIRSFDSNGNGTIFAGVAGNATLGLNFPYGLAFDATGDLYVSNQGDDTMRKIASNGTGAVFVPNGTLLGPGFIAVMPECAIYEPYCITNLAGLALTSGSLDATGSAARFNQPWGVAVDSAGTAYVADTLNHTIRKVTAGGVVTLVAGTSGSAGFADGAASTALFSRPTGVAVNSAGTVIFVADYNNHNVRKIDLSQAPSSATYVTTLAGSVTGVAGTNDATGSAAQFRNPFGVAVDGAGNVFVSDQNNQTVRKITAGGVVTTYAGSPNVNGYLNGAQNGVALFNTPRGIAVDSSGNVYVADSGNFTVRKISGGFVTTLAGHPFTPFLAGCDDGPGSGARFSAVQAISPFGGPTGLAVDSLGNVYVTDQGNHTIRKITPGGSVTTLAGYAPVSGSADGTGSGAQFNFPGGVAVSATGKLYVADTLNHTIRFQCPCEPGVVKIGLYAGLAIEGSVGCRYRIDYTTFLNPNPSLTVWTTLTTVTLSSSPFLYLDTSAPAVNNRFYRVVAL
jgi:DNA-binding beta-propeller fold protein YncE